jgi:glycolate oxidase
MTKYRRLTKKLLGELTAIAGQANVSLSETDITNYSVDETPEIKPYAPEVVVRPLTAGMVSDVLRFANTNRIPVTPRGQGTGLSGGCVPLSGGIVMSMERMNQVVRINPDNFSAVVEPGVTLNQLAGELASYRLHYPVHIGDMSATIGGTVATNAGGMNAVKYGVTRQHVLGVQAVLASGAVIDAGGEYIKCSTGYDLTQMLIGSEGTLAVVTRIILRVMPLPGTREILFVPFNNLQNAIRTVPLLLRLKTIPMGIEFLDGDVVRLIEKYVNMKVPHDQEEAFLMIIMEGDSTDDIVQYFGQIESICRQNGAVEFYVPGDELAKRRLIEFREKAYEAIRRAGPFALIDVVVPRNEIATFMEKVRKISQDLDMPAPSMGHVGDGNIHIHPICFDPDVEAWRRKLPELMERIYRAGSELGGTISGEHGIGFEKKKYLPIALSPETINLMKKIKLQLDPHEILNPGKVFDL